MKKIKILSFVCFAFMFIFLTKIVHETPSNLLDEAYYIVSIFYIGALIYLLFVKEKIRIFFIFIFLIGTINILGAPANWDWGFLIGILILFTLVVGMLVYYISEKEKEQ